MHLPTSGFLHFMGLLLGAVSGVLVLSLQFDSAWRMFFSLSLQ